MVTGVVHIGQAIYKVEPLGGELQAVILENAAALPPEPPEDYPEGALEEGDMEDLKMLLEKPIEARGTPAWVKALMDSVGLKCC